MGRFEYIYGSAIAVEGPCSTTEYKGILRTSWPDWSGWKEIDQRNATGAPMTSASLALAVEQFYRRNFYDALELDKIKDTALAADVFEVAVAFGRQIAVKMLHEAYNLLAEIPVTVYSDISPMILARVNEFPQARKYRATYMVLAGSRFSSKPEFFRKWMLGTA